jgi:hypothetical protein
MRSIGVALPLQLPVVLHREQTCPSFAITTTGHFPYSEPSGLLPPGKTCADACKKEATHTVSAVLHYCQTGDHRTGENVMIT